LWSAILLLLLMRFGLLATAAALFFQNILVCFPITTQLSAWYSGSSCGTASTSRLTLYAFHTSLGGRRMFGARLWMIDAQDPAIGTMRASYGSPASVAATPPISASLDGN